MEKVEINDIKKIITDKVGLGYVIVNPQLPSYFWIYDTNVSEWFSISVHDKMITSDIDSCDGDDSLIHKIMSWKSVLFFDSLIEYFNWYDYNKEGVK